MLITSRYFPPNHAAALLCGIGDCDKLELQHSAWVSVLNDSSCCTFCFSHEFAKKRERSANVYRRKGKKTAPCLYCSVIRMRRYTLGGGTPKQRHITKSNFFDDGGNPGVSSFGVKCFVP